MNDEKKNIEPRSIQNLAFKLEAFKILSFELRELPLELIQEGPELNYKVEQQFGIIPEQKIILITHDVYLNDKRKDYKEEYLLKMRTQSIFSISGGDELFNTELNKEIELPEQLMGTMINFSLGMIRGVLHVKAMGWVIDNLIMPPFQIKDLIPPEKFKPAKK